MSSKQPESAESVPEAVRGAESAENHADLSFGAKIETRKIFTAETSAEYFS